MKNYICTGERMVVTAPAGGLNPGDVFIVGSKAVVVLSGGIEGDLVTCITEGVVELPKAVGAIGQGVKLYWDDAANNLTVTAAANTYMGYAYIASLSGDATTQVTLVDNPA